jgi:hypothetical protein
MKTYSTGEVAKICGLKNARYVARLFDYGKIEGDIVPSRYHRRSTRRIPLKALIEFMKEKGIPLEKLDEDIDAQKWILCQQTSELKRMIEKARKRSGVLFGFKGLPTALLDVVSNLDPLSSLQGVSEDKKRVIVFRTLVKVMERHIKLRGAIAGIRRK